MLFGYQGLVFCFAIQLGFLYCYSCLFLLYNYFPFFSFIFSSSIWIELTCKIVIYVWFNLYPVTSHFPSIVHSSLSWYLQCLYVFVINKKLCSKKNITKAVHEREITLTKKYSSFFVIFNRWDCGFEFNVVAIPKSINLSLIPICLIKFWNQYLLLAKICKLTQCDFLTYIDEICQLKSI